MKLRILLLTVALLLLAPLALAEGEAPEITRSASLTYAFNSSGRGTLTDGSYLSYFSGAYLEVKTTTPCQHLYFSFAMDEVAIAIQVPGENGGWSTSSPTAAATPTAISPCRG